MNNERRKRIAAIADSLEDLKGEIASILDEEQDSEKGQAMEEAVDNLEYAADEIDSALDNLREIS